MVVERDPKGASSASDRAERLREVAEPIGSARPGGRAAGASSVGRAVREGTGRSGTVAFLRFLRGPPGHRRSPTARGRRGALPGSNAVSDRSAPCTTTGRAGRCGGVGTSRDVSSPPARSSTRAATGRWPGRRERSRTDARDGDARRVEDLGGAGRVVVPAADEDEDLVGRDTVLQAPDDLACQDQPEPFARGPPRRVRPSTARAPAGLARRGSVREIARPVGSSGSCSSSSNSSLKGPPKGADGGSSGSPVQGRVTSATSLAPDAHSMGAELRLRGAHRFEDRHEGRPIERPGRPASARPTRRGRGHPRHNARRDRAVVTEDRPRGAD